MPRFSRIDVSIRPRSHSAPLWDPPLWISLVLALLAIGGCAVDHTNVPASAPVSERTLAVHTVCAAGDATLDGIDVSKWQGAVDWSAVKADGVAFGFARVSDGLTVPDATFSPNWSGMKQAAVIRGAYQFFRPSQDAAAQADLLIQAIAGAGGIDAADLPPVLDVETDSGLSASAVADKIAAWIARIEEVLGRKPIIYSGSYFWDDQVSSTAYASYPLWTAHYTSEACPYVPDAWQAWTFWQYTDSGAVQGVNGNVDRNVFAGDTAALQAFIASTVIGPCVPTGPEICGDGLDNDCQNGVDDGCEDPPCTPSGAEICDGKDNDCNGLTDDAPGGCDGPPTCPGVPETCNGLDDDCDGLVDEEDPEGGGPCTISLGSEAFAGIEHCIDGQLVCRVAGGDPTDPPTGGRRLIGGCAVGDAAPSGATLILLLLLASLGCVCRRER